jgi:hypothetical protein
MSAVASTIDSWILGWDSQNSFSCKDSHSSIPISTAPGVPFLVIVTCSWVIYAASSDVTGDGCPSHRKPGCIKPLRPLAFS